MCKRAGLYYQVERVCQLYKKVHFFLLVMLARSQLYIKKIYEAGLVIKIKSTFY